jgi:hypothetical protein
MGQRAASGTTISLHECKLNLAASVIDPHPGKVHISGTPTVPAQEIKP